MIPWFFGHFWKCSEVVEFWHVDTFKNGRKIKGSFLLWALQLQTGLSGMQAKYVIQTVNNSTLGKLENCKLDKEIQQNFFPTLNHNQMIM